MINLKDAIKSCFRFAHSVFRRSGILDKLGFFALGEKNSYCINPIYLTIDVADADKILQFHDGTILPIDDGRANILYSSHNLEHLPMEAAEKFFAEAYRCLKPGGELLIEVPNCELLYKQFTQGKWSDANPNIPGKGGNRSFHQYFQLDPEGKRLVGLLQDKQMVDLCDSPHVTFLSVISSFRHPPFTGIGATVVVQESEFESAMRELSMEQFFDWCINLKSKQQRGSGGHSSAWYPERLLNTLVRHGFISSLRQYREARNLSWPISYFLIPDRKHRSFYSFRVSAIKPA